MYAIKIIPQAQKDFSNLPSAAFDKIKIKILEIAKNPRPYGAVKLTQQEGYRIRTGDYRILYRIDDALKEIYIYRAKHRKEVYR